MRDAAVTVARFESFTDALVAGWDAVRLAGGDVFRAWAKLTGRPEPSVSDVAERVARALQEELAAKPSSKL